MKKIWSLLLVTVMTTMLVMGCGTKADNSTDQKEETVEQEEKTEEAKVEETTYPLTITDQAGNTVTIEKEPERLVSGYYISSSTCLALGLKDKLVAVEEGIEKRPIYKYMASDIMDKVGNVGSAKNFDLEACIAAKPDLVILPKKAKDYAATLAEVDIPAIVVTPENHEKLVEMVNLIGQATNKNTEAKALTDKYAEIQDKIAGLTKDIKGDQPVVYMCGPSSYLTTAPKDMYQASLIQTAGGKNAGDSLDGDSWTEVSYEQILAMNPDIIVIPTNNMANGQPDFTAEEVMADENLAEVKAVKDKKVYNMPAGYEAWDSPVPSGILGMLWMTATLHPDVYSMSEFADDAADFYKTFYNFDIDKSTITG